MMCLSYLSLRLPVPEGLRDGALTVTAAHEPSEIERRWM